MPERAAYDEAILFSKARIKVQDQELKEGQVETITLQTVAGSIKRPWGIQGGFAVVYKYSTSSGQKRALRCFLAKMDPDIQFRYERISNYFASYAPQVSVGFKYYESGILLKETIYGQIQKNVYPLVEMEWIEGQTLIEYVDTLCKKHDTAALGKLVEQWHSTIKVLQQASISHGDLAGVNVMLHPDGRLVLVDYDGVYIPDFAGFKPIVLGQTDYQHPQITLRPFNERTDDFSAWVIYTALLALHLNPKLWFAYMHFDGDLLLDTNLLFRKEDFADPDRSPLLAELVRSPDSRLCKAARLLIHASKQPVTQVPPFDPEQLDPDAGKKQALQALKLAIQNNDNQAIVQAWASQLDTYPPAQSYAPRVAQARQFLDSFNHFQQALQTGSIQQVAQYYDPAFVHSKNLTAEQAEILSLALPFITALRENDTQALTSAWQQINASRLHHHFVLTQEIQERLTQAQKRQMALLNFRKTLMNKLIFPIVTAYDATLLDAYSAVTSREHELLRVAQDFAQAYQSNDDQAIVASSEAIQNSSYRNNFLFTTQELHRIELAQLRKAALVKFRLGVMSKNMEKMIASYDWILDDCTSITQQERDLLQMAKTFVQASYQNNDAGLVAAWEKIQKASYQRFFKITPQEQHRVETARKKTTALATFRQALASKQLQKIVASYDIFLDEEKSITAQERLYLQAAQQLVQALQSDDEQEITTAWLEIQNYAHLLELTSQEQEAISLAQRRKDAVRRFRLALMSKRIEQIVTAYDRVLDDRSSLTAREKMSLSLAKALLQALHDNHDPTIVHTWAAIENSPYHNAFLLTEPERTRIQKAQQNMSHKP